MIISVFKFEMIDFSWPQKSDFLSIYYIFAADKTIV